MKNKKIVALALAVSVLSSSFLTFADIEEVLEAIDIPEEVTETLLTEDAVDSSEEATETILPEEPESDPVDSEILEVSEGAEPSEDAETFVDAEIPTETEATEKPEVADIPQEGSEEGEMLTEPQPEASPEITEEPKATEGPEVTEEPKTETVGNITGDVMATNANSITLLASSSDVVSGYCGASSSGEELTWVLDKTTGVLTISGTGGMSKYAYGYSSKHLTSAPWGWYINYEKVQITDIIIEEGVTSVSDYAFAGCKANGTLTLPSTLINIGHCAFELNNFTGNLTIPNSVTSIENGAFADCSCFTGILIIPDSVTYIEPTAFSHCNGITDMYINRPENSISTGTFPNTVHWAYDLSECTVSLENDYYTYTGSEIKPEVTVTSSDGNTLVLDDDYTVSYSDNINAGTATVTISAPNGGISYNTNSATFTIAKASLSGANFGGLTSQSYTGSAITPNFLVTVEGGKALKKDTDYTVSYSNNINVGTAKITITGKGNYTGTASTTFTITSTAISSVTVGTIASQTYTGSAITPNPTITYGGKTLTKDTDYSLSYSNNTNVGTATVTITGKGAYTGTATTMFEITAADISLASISGVSSQTYTGSEITPEPTLTYAGQTLIKNTDYMLDYENNTSAGSMATITITGKGNFNGTTTTSFYISNPSGGYLSPADAALYIWTSSGKTRFYDTVYTYTAEEIMPLSGVAWELQTEYDTYGDGDGRVDVTYSNNINVGTGIIHISIVDFENYEGGTAYVEYDFQINPAPISDAVIADMDAQTYTGSAITPEPVLTFNGKTLTKDVDYTLSYSNNTNAGTATITITGMGNFTGTTTKTFTIGTREISDATINNVPDSQTYTGSAFTPEPTLTFNGKTLTKDVDYALSYADNINAGTATITITGKGNFGSTTTVTFVINPAPFDSSTVTVGDIPSETYNGNKITPTPTVTYNGKTLTKDEDYTLSYSNNKNAGTATVNIIGKGNYTGTISSNFTILAASLSGATVTFPDDISYQGEPCEPETTVVVNGKTLVKGQDYSVTYSNNNGEGTGAATITGIGNYTGTLNEQFEIGPFDPRKAHSPIDMSEVNVTLSESEFTYNGNEHTPKPTVTYNVTEDYVYTLVEGTDYSISYENNVNAGSGKITLTGIKQGEGGFESTKSIFFNISACELSDTEIADIPSAEYCKKDICPEPEIKIGDTVLTKDVDYTLEYENNRNRGTASVIITGKGNLTGTVTKTFEITPRDGSKFTIIVLL